MAEPISDERLAEVLDRITPGKRRGVSRRIRLTNRQIDALYLLGYQNFTVAETAAVMGISAQTARDYAHQLRSIFGVKRTRDIVPHAHRWFAYGRLPQK